MDFKKNVSNYSSKKMEKLTQTTIRQGGIVLKEAIQTPETYLKNNDGIIILSLYFFAECVLNPVGAFLVT